MHLTRFPRPLHCLGDCSVDDFLGSGWGFVVLGSCSLCSFLYNFLGLGLCSYLCSLGPECCSSIGGRLMSCIVGYFALEGEGCSTGGVAVEGQRLRSFYFLRIHFGAILLSGH